MKRGKFLGMVCVIAMVAGLLVAGCAGEAPPTEGPPTEGPPTEGPPEEEVFELTLTHQHPAECSIQVNVTYPWTQWIERESGGRIHITIFPADTLVTAPDHFDAARTGTADIACQTLMMAPGLLPLNEVVELPLIYGWPGCKAQCMTHMALVEKYPEMLQEIEGKGVKWLGAHGNGPSQIHNSEKPIHTLEDWQGQVMLGMGPYAADAVAALGGTPESMGPWEMYDAAAKGVIDGYCLEWEGHFVWHMNEVMSYSTEVSLWLTPMMHVMNIDTWNSLPPDLQELFIGENAERYFEMLGYNFDMDDIMWRDALEEQYADQGMPPIYVLPEDERARWVAAIQPIWEAWVSNVSDIVGEDTARAILQDAVAFAEQYSWENRPCDWCADELREWGAPDYQEYPVE